MFTLSVSKMVNGHTIPEDRALSQYPQASIYKQACARGHRTPKRSIYSQSHRASGIPQRPTCQGASSNPERISQPLPEQTHLSQKRTRRLLANGRQMRCPLDNVCVSGTTSGTWLELPENLFIILRKVHHSPVLNRLVCVLLFLTTWYKQSFLHTANLQFL